MAITVEQLETAIERAVANNVQEVNEILEDVEFIASYDLPVVDVYDVEIEGELVKFKINESGTELSSFEPDDISGSLGRISADTPIDVDYFMTLLIPSEEVVNDSKAFAKHFLDNVEVVNYNVLSLLEDEVDTDYLFGNGDDEDDDWDDEEDEDRDGDDDDEEDY